MPNLRLLLILLLALNLLAFAAIRGWLGSADHEGEPERISNQLNPERIRLLRELPPPAAHASPAATAASPAADEAVAQAPTVAQVPDAPDGASADGGQAPSPGDAPPAPRAPAGPPSAPAAAAAPATAQCFAWGGLSEAEAAQLLAALRREGVEGRRGAHDIPVSWWVRIAPEGGLEGAQERSRALRALGIGDSYIVQDDGPSKHAISLGLFKTEAGAQRMVEDLRARGLLDAGVEPRMRQAIRVQAELSTEARDAVERGLPRLRRQRDDCGR